MAAPRSKTRLVCAKERPVRCISLIFAIPMATSCAGFIACQPPEPSRSKLRRAAPSGRSSRAKEDRLAEQRSGGGRRLLASAAALDLPLSLHTATRRQGRIRRAGDKTLTKAFYLRADPLRRLRASSPPDTGHRGVRASVGAPPALHDGLHVPRAPRRGGFTGSSLGGGARFPVRDASTVAKNAIRSMPYRPIPYAS